MIRDIVAIGIGVAGLLLMLPSAEAQQQGEEATLVQFAGTLVQYRAYLLPDADRALADAINRDLREAQTQARRAATEEVKQQAAQKRKAATQRLEALLDAAQSAISLAVGSARTVLPSPPSMAWPAGTGALLFRVSAGEGAIKFLALDCDFSEFSRSRYVVNVEAGGPTWVVIAFKNVPMLETRQEVEFALAGGGSTVLPLTFTTPARGSLRVTVLSDDTGKPVPAMVRLVSRFDEQEVKPGGAIDFAPQFDRQGNFSGRRRSNLPGRLAGTYWCVPGKFSTALAPGQWQIVIARGIEHVPVFDTVRLAPGQTLEKVYTLRRWVDMRKRGWYSGDDHVHCQILSDADAERLLMWVQAEDVRLANVVKMGDVYRTWFEQRGFGTPFRVEKDGYILSPGQECPRTHNELGHTLHMNISRMIRDTERYYLYDTVFDAVHADGGLSGYAHVNLGLFHVHRDMTLNIPRQKVDFVELLQFATLGTDLFYDFLNTGFKVTASAGSDVPWGGSVGEARVYAHVGRKQFTADRWFEAVQRGNTFVTNGVMLDFRVDEAIPGDEIVAKGDRMLRVRARAWGYPEHLVPSKLEIVVHGEVIKKVEAPAAGAAELQLDFALPAGYGFWIAARAEGSDGSRAHTTPVYVIRDGLRFWKHDAVHELIAKRMASLAEIEQIVAQAADRDKAGELEDNRPLKQLALQGPELLARVQTAKALYQELAAVAERERAVRKAPWTMLPGNDVVK